jgi:predicted PurR-regulated permease PerM
MTARTDGDPRPDAASEKLPDDTVNEAADDAVDDGANDFADMEELAEEVPPGGPAPRPGPPGGLRSALSHMTTRMVAERALRAAQAAEEDSRRAAQAASDAVTQGEERRSGLFTPFRIGLMAGLGLLVAYTLYLSLDTIRGTLIVIAIAAVVAIGLNPAVGLLERRGMRRGVAVAIVFVALLVFIAGVIYTVVPVIVDQIASFINSLPDIIAKLEKNPTIQSLDNKFGFLETLKNTDFIKNIGGTAAGGIVTVGFTLAGIAVDMLIALILTLYFLAGLPRIKAASYRLVPASRRPRVSEIGDKIIKQMGGYLGGATLIALQAGIVAGTFSWIIGLPFPWAIGLAATLLDYVPVVGPIIIGVGMALLGFTQSVVIGIVAGAFYLCQHLFEAYWLYPRVMRRTVDISTAAVIVAIVIGAALLGIPGAILAVPVAAAVQLIVREVVVPAQERR